MRRSDAVPGRGRRSRPERPEPASRPRARARRRWTDGGGSHRHRRSRAGGHHHPELGRTASPRGRRIGVRRREVHRGHDRKRHRPVMNIVIRLALAALGVPLLASRPVEPAPSTLNVLRGGLAHRGVHRPGSHPRAADPRPHGPVQLRGVPAAGTPDRTGRAGRRVRLGRPALDGLREGKGRGGRRGADIRAESSHRHRAQDESRTHRRAARSGPPRNQDRHGRRSGTGREVQPRGAAEAGRRPRLSRRGTTGRCSPTWCRRKRT